MCVVSPKKGIEFAFYSSSPAAGILGLEFTHFLTSKTHLTPMDKGEGAFS